MKKLFTLLLFCLPILGIAQSIDSTGTTLEEYKYLTSGVKGYIDNGLDMKSGYSISEVSSSTLNFSDASRTVRVYKFFKKGYKNPKALLLIYSKVGSGDFYICVPQKYSDDSIWKDVFKKLNTLTGSEPLMTLAYSLMVFNSEEIVK
ncbi:hypothetical protein [Pedobacter alpinus]|uniref:Uncharacterized protein n=1 Tax=Pedobacter alpinus TaxID=1590643 RepID=A0ABW5TTM6_9SPHI